jgi:hypothetical protein
MKGKLTITKANALRSYPAGYPAQEFMVDRHKVTRKQLRSFIDLLEASSGETAVDEFLRENREVLAMCIREFGTGHHGTWIFPQHHLRPHISTTIPGLKPDYIVAGLNSDGFTWWIIELKSPSASIFHEAGTDVWLSNEANKGLFQLYSYLDFAVKNQSQLREVHGLGSFEAPKGVLLIGRESELESEKKRRMKKILNQTNNVTIHTYDALVREAKETLHIGSSNRNWNKGGHDFPGYRVENVE